MCCSVSHPSCHNFFFFFTCKALKFPAWGSGIQRTSQTLHGWLITKEKWRQSGRWGRLWLWQVFFSRSRNSLVLGEGGVVVASLSRRLASQASPVASLPLILLSPPVLVPCLHHWLERGPQTTVFLAVPLPVNHHQKPSGCDCFKRLFQFTTGSKVLPAWHQDSS